MAEAGTLILGTGENFCERNAGPALWLRAIGILLLGSVLALVGLLGLLGLELGMSTLQAGTLGAFSNLGTQGESFPSGFGIPVILSGSPFSAAFIALRASKLIGADLSGR